MVGCSDEYSEKYKNINNADIYYAEDWRLVYFNKQVICTTNRYWYGKFITKVSVVPFSS